MTVFHICYWTGGENFYAGSVTLIAWFCEVNEYSDARRWSKVDEGSVLVQFEIMDTVHNFNLNRAPNFNLNHYLQSRFLDTPERRLLNYAVFFCTKT